MGGVLRVHLVIGDVADRAPLVRHPVTETGSRVAQHHGLDGEFSDGEFFLPQVAEIDARAEFANGYGEEYPVHLQGDELTHAEVALAGAHYLDFVALLVQRRKKRNRVDVVPMRMGNNELGGNS